MNIKKSFSKLPTTALLLIAAGAVHAEGTTLDATLTATIRETTCDMKLSGGIGSDTQQKINVTLPGNDHPWIPLADGQAGKGIATFKLQIIECPASLSSLKTTIKGTADVTLKTGLANQIAKADGGAEYAALEIARTTATTAPFTINSETDAGRLVWTDTEIDKKEVSLTATLRETQPGLMSLGKYTAVATFEFSYE